MNEKARPPALDLWRPDLATGIPEVDAQHRELLERIAALYAAARHGDTSHAPESLAYRERYAAEHFAAEERAMAALAYPALAEHAALHATFRDALAQRKRDFGVHGSESILLVDLLCWMDGWLNDHVRAADAAMARFVRSEPGRLAAFGGP